VCLAYVLQDGWCKGQQGKGSCRDARQLDSKTSKRRRGGRTEERATSCRGSRPLLMPSPPVVLWRVSAYTAAGPGCKARGATPMLHAVEAK